MTTKKRQASQKIDDLKTEVKTDPWKWFCVCASLVVVVWGIPKLVQCESGGEYLAYLGAVFGAATALIAVSSQVHSDEKARKEEFEQSSRPVIWVGRDIEFEEHRSDGLNVLPRKKLIASQEQQSRMDLKNDIDHQRDYVIIASEDGKWGLEVRERKNLDEQFCLKAHSVDYYSFSDGGASITVCSPYHAIPLIIKNVGLGPALNFRPGIRFRTEDSASCFLSPGVLGVGEEERVVICVDDSEISEKTSLSFDFTVTFETIPGMALRSVTEVCFQGDGKGNWSYRLKFVPKVEPVNLKSEEW